MGVAGASAAVGEGRFVLLAGIAGLLSGAFSMAAGEYISMQSQRELFERQIELERAELEAMPEEEQEELAAVYVSKGFTKEEADTIAARMFKDPQHALDTLVREELGLDPGRARVGVGRGARIVRRVRDRRGHPGDPVPVRLGWCPVLVLDRGVARGALPGRCRGQPADGPEPALLREPARSGSARPRPPSPTSSATSSASRSPAEPCRTCGRSSSRSPWVPGSVPSRSSGGIGRWPSASAAGSSSAASR